MLFFVILYFFNNCFLISQCEQYHIPAYICKLAKYSPAIPILGPILVPMLCVGTYTDRRSALRRVSSYTYWTQSVRRFGYNAEHCNQSILILVPMLCVGTYTNQSAKAIVQPALTRRARISLLSLQGAVCSGQPIEPISQARPGATRLN